MKTKLLALALMVFIAATVANISYAQSGQGGFKTVKTKKTTNSSPKKTTTTQKKPDPKRLALSMDKLEGYRTNPAYTVKALTQYNEKDGYGLYIMIYPKDSMEAPIYTWFHVHLDKKGKVTEPNAAHFKAGPGKGDGQGFAVDNKKAEEFMEEMKNKDIPTSGKPVRISK